MKKILSLEYASAVIFKFIVIKNFAFHLNILFYLMKKKADFKRYVDELIIKEFQQNPVESDSIEIQSNVILYYF